MKSKAWFTIFFWLPDDLDKISKNGERLCLLLPA